MTMLDPNSGRMMGPNESAFMDIYRGVPADSWLDPYGARLKTLRLNLASADAALGYGGPSSGNSGSSRMSSSMSSSSSRPVATLDPVRAKDSSEYTSQLPSYQQLYTTLWGDTKPEIDRTGIWNDNQIQARVNQARAQNDQSMAGMMRRTGESMASQGFGSRSPLLASLMQNAFMQNMAANTGAENNLRYEAAKGNADQLLASQTAYEQSLAKRTEQTQAQRSQELALLNALMNNDAANYAAYAGWAKTPVTSSSSRSVSYG